MRNCSLEREGDVLRFHAGHAHVLGRNATVDRRDVTFFEAEEREEPDRRTGVGNRNRHMIRIEYHLVTPCDVHSGSPAPGELPAVPLASYLNPATGAAPRSR